MDFPITNLMDREACLTWIKEYFHPDGLQCPHCRADFEQARWFRQTKCSQLDVYRYFRPEQTVLFIRGVCQGKPTAKLARELSISRTTATEVRHKLQANAEKEQPETPLEDEAAETDEMFQNAGEKKRVA